MTQRPLEPEIPPATSTGDHIVARDMRRLALGLTLAALAIASMTFFAWLLPGAPESWRLLLAMKMNTAAALLCAGIANAIRIEKHDSGSAEIFATVLAALVVLAGVATLSQYLFGWDLGIDQLLAVERSPGVTSPGRMGSNTAVSLSLLGFGFILDGRRHPLAQRAGEASIIVAGFIGGVGFVGNLLGVEAFSTVETHARMAAHTALAIIALTLSILLSHPERGVVGLIAAGGVGSFMARRLIPVVLVVPVLVGFVASLGVRAGLYDAELGASINVVAAIVTLLAVVLQSARSLNYTDAEKKRSDAQLRELSQTLVWRAHELEEANRELEAFSYSVSHDLRSPIRHIGGYADLLERRSAGQLDEKSIHYVKTISQSARRAGELIDDLLSFSRMGRAELERRGVDTNACVDEAWRELEPERAGRKIELDVARLPKTTGDPNMLRLVFRNLLSNAVKYSRPREKATIVVGADVRDRDVVYFVRDNGVGFDMRYVDKLFGVFQRLHGPETFEGHGIGLANVKRVIQRHGGRVWAQGAVDQGATFYFSLPRNLEGDSP